jgi:hypothetical protein
MSDPRLATIPAGCGNRLRLHWKPWGGAGLRGAAAARMAAAEAEQGGGGGAHYEGGAAAASSAAALNSPSMV